jgi:hypothetical protein
MAYYIFLKSLRSLEEFRKNHHVKFQLNLLLQISKALLQSKINFLFGKEFFFTFGPERPSGQSPHPASQPGHSPRPIPACAASSSSLRSPAATPFPLSPPRGLHLSAPLSPPRRQPRSEFPRAAASRLGCPRAFTALPHHFSLLIPFKSSVHGP